jgi:hypothetical protein
MCKPEASFHDELYLSGLEYPISKRMVSRSLLLDKLQIQVGEPGPASEPFVTRPGNNQN